MERHTGDHSDPDRQLFGGSETIAVNGEVARHAAALAPRPIDIVVDIVTSVDTSLSASVVSAAVVAVVPRGGRRYQLAWALQDRPDLLTGPARTLPSPRCCG